MKPKPSSDVASDVLLRAMDAFDIDAIDASKSDIALKAIDNRIKQDRAVIVGWYRERLHEFACATGADTEATCSACGAPVVVARAKTNTPGWQRITMFTIDGERHDDVCAHRKVHES
jgi:hypothetical protein